MRYIRKIGGERKGKKENEKKTKKCNGEPVTMLTSRSIVQQMGEDGKEKTAAQGHDSPLHWHGNIKTKLSPYAK